MKKKRKRWVTHQYTHWQIKLLKKHRKLPREQLAVMFNERYWLLLSPDAIRSTCLRLGFKTGRSGCFKKGSVSWSKGKKIPWVPNAGNFQKGQRSHNAVPVGSEAFTTKDLFIKVKVAEPNVWEFKHVRTWERYRGKLPKGMVLRFRDCDRNNCKLSNLFLASKALNLLLNQLRYHEVAPEFRKSVLLTAQLKEKMFLRMKGK